MAFTEEAQKAIKELARQMKAFQEEMKTWPPEEQEAFRRSQEAVGEFLYPWEKKRKPDEK